MRLPPLPDPASGFPICKLGVAFYAGYDKIAPVAWAQWERAYEAYRKMQRLDGREARVP
jgi:hypothetical protein